MESIDALAKAVNEFEGGLVLVSHDMRLISQVAKEIWICDNRSITKYKGDIMNFKMDMRQQMGIEEEGKKLRGDASVKTTDKAKKEKPKKPEPKLEIVAPKAPPAPATIPEEKPAPAPAPTPTQVSLPSSPSAAPTKDSSAADDDATAITTATGNSGSTSVSSSTNGDNAPKRYIPPHLRKKMALEQQQQQS